LRLLRRARERPGTRSRLPRSTRTSFLFGGDLIWGAWPWETLELAPPRRPRAIHHGQHRPHGARRRRRLLCLGAGAAVARAARARAGLAGDASLDGGALLPRNATQRHRARRARFPEASWAEALDGVEERVVVCGHTHLQYDEQHAGRRVSIRAVSAFHLCGRLHGGRVSVTRWSCGRRTTTRARPRTPGVPPASLERTSPTC
jgi:hypothetical protein